MMRMVMVTTTLTTMVTSSMMLFAKPYPIATYTFSPTFKTWRIFWSCEKTNIEYFCVVKTLRDYHLLLVEFFAVVWQFGRCILLHLVLIQYKDLIPISQNLFVIFPLDFLLSGLFTMALPYQSCGNGEECWSFGIWAVSWAPCWYFYVQSMVQGSKLITKT